MADEILVKTATASLSPVIPALVIVVSTHTLSLAASEPFFSISDNEALLESDIDAAFATFTTTYTMAPYAGGTLLYQSLKSISGLSELVNKNGEPVALKTTEGTITCSVTVPALSASDSSPDTTLSYDLDFSFTDAAQTLAKSD